MTRCQSTECLCMCFGFGHFWGFVLMQIERVSFFSPPSSSSSPARRKRKAWAKRRRRQSGSKSSLKTLPKEDDSDDACEKSWPAFTVLLASQHDCLDNFLAKLRYLCNSTHPAILPMPSANHNTCYSSYCYQFKWQCPFYLLRNCWCVFSYMVNLLL